MSIGSSQILNLVDHQFNKSKRKLFLFLEEIRTKISLSVFGIGRLFYCG